MMLLLLLALAVAFIVVAVVKLRLHPFLALMLSAIGFGLLAGMPGDAIVTAVKEGFGNTLGAVGPIIVVGVMIGALLEVSGGAYALANRVMRWLGEKRVTWGMALVGFVTSIPVFGDSAFIILQSLNRALTRRAGLSLAVTATALAAGTTASHCLVPPTPGPIAAAELVNADLGMVIAWGAPIALLSVVPPVFWARWMGSRIWIDPKPRVAEATADRAETGPAPGALKSSLPIFVPLLLIMVKTMNDYLGLLSEGAAAGVVSFIGSPLIALLIGLGFAVRLPASGGLAMLSMDGPAGKAVRAAAVIIVITGAGGVFGMMLRSAGVAELLGTALGGATLGLWLPFVVAAAIRVAQGSATVAIVTTAAMVTPLLGPLGVDSDLGRALVVLSIGAGSAVFSHANDSGFWVITQLSDMSVSQGLRLHTVATGLLGISAAILVNLAWWLWGGVA
ncbi:GntP family permease [Marinihelvus fidelis]|uniref:GntP family permease n=1 Tax=Marinihelvus fidelis TaxID=2613842 RepID=A0A5N0TID0_9GAMM|nr:SLC13 family permease [Marinihelvus fidelis]KAA9134184.1 GntP family permease [Marinihelvus fidelis]